MQAAQILKAPLFLSRLFFKLKRQSGGRDVLYILRDRLGMATDRAIAIGKKLKIMASPLLARKRFAARNLSKVVPSNLATEGWIKLPKGEVEGAEEVARHCAKILRAERRRCWRPISRLSA